MDKTVEGDLAVEAGTGLRVDTDLTDAVIGACDVIPGIPDIPDIPGIPDRTAVLGGRRYE